MSATVPVHDERARLALALCSEAQDAVGDAYRQRASVAAMASDEGCSMREIAGAMGLSVSVTHRIIHLGRSLRRQP